MLGDITTVTTQSDFSRFSEAQLQAALDETFYANISEDTAKKGMSDIEIPDEIVCSRVKYFAVAYQRPGCCRPREELALCGVNTSTLPLDKEQCERLARIREIFYIREFYSAGTDLGQVWENSIKESILIIGVYIFFGLFYAQTCINGA